MEFKKYRKDTRLDKDGFQIFKPEKEITLTLMTLGSNLEFRAQASKDSDVFRTKLGDIKQIQNLHLTFPEQFKELNDKLVNLIGAKKYKILNNQYFAKPPNYKMTSAHQDNAYFESDRNVVTFWLPLQDVDILNSCMFYVPKSHLNGLVKHNPIGTNIRTRTGKKGVSLYSDYYKNKEFVKVPMKFGEILVHDKDCMHFSSPNLSDDYRIAITAIMEILD